MTLSLFRGPSVRLIATAALLACGTISGFAEDAANQLVLAKVSSGQPLRYYVGAGWTKSGQFSSQADWNAYIATEAARAKSPVKFEIGAAPAE